MPTTEHIADLQNHARDHFAEYRYRTDSMFHMLVDTIESQIYNGYYTPSELREAVILASTHYEVHCAKLER
jgi:hypothetical protein